MERFLQAKVLDADPNAPGADKKWNHWHRSFTFFLSSIQQHNPNKLEQLVNHVSTEVYDFISECQTYEEAIDLLNRLFIKPKNELFARHVLSIAKQEVNENLDQYFQRLKNLAKDCNYRSVSADVYRDESIRDVLIRGFRSSSIRQRILESRNTELQAIFEQARSLELAQEQSSSFYSSTKPEICAKTSFAKHNTDSESESTECDILASSVEHCFFCGSSRHPRSKCPARDATCKACGKKGHFKRVCRSTGTASRKPTASILSAITVAASPECLSTAIIDVSVNGRKLQALVDTGSSESYLSSAVIRRNHWKCLPSRSQISMATSNLQTCTMGHCMVTLKYKETIYRNVKLAVLDNLCSDVLLGHDFLQQHQQLVIPFNGKKPPFNVCGLLAANIEPPELFAHLAPNCKPITTKSRRHSFSDQRFIEGEIRRLLNENIIQPSNSPWRAQVLVSHNGQGKRRMVVDYSQTINRFTHLDAFPLPRIDHMIEKIARYKFFSTLDLKSAYHQVPIRESDQIYTAFEACGRLYQFRRIPFGVTNGVACFQRVIDNIILNANLKDTFAYVDNLTICGNSEAEHKDNLNAFLAVAEKYGLTFNDSKSHIAKTSIRLLGYEVSQNAVRPDPERMQPLRDLPLPVNMKTQQRVVGIFAYYSQWIHKYSDKIHPLVSNSTFPLPATCQEAFHQLKRELENAVIVNIDRTLPLTIETDASDVAIAATLNQQGRPVAFFSRTLSRTERHYASVEKEAHAVVEAIRKWRHYLIGSRFTVVTDQKSVAFMYNKDQRGKIKNDKIQRWRIELSCYNFDVVYRPGKDNVAADTLSRAYCGASHTISNLKDLHESLCHAGIVRLSHFVRSKNLPFSQTDVKYVVSQCNTCAKLKPKFFKPALNSLIKATQPFERLSIDFKGPLPSVTHNKYLLTAIDEYSRFPFAFACPDMKASTVIRCLEQLFAIFGMPQYIHSDRGTAFLSEELRHYLHEKSIATSYTSGYNPQSNGQVERLNGTLWRAISLSLDSQHRHISEWETALLDALHSVRSLLCTATNATPHERMFTYQRKSTNGTSLPSWLTSSGKVLVRNFNQQSKYEPLVQEVDLLDCNPQYAHIRFPSGRESTVSLRHLAPTPDSSNDPSVANASNSETSPTESDSNEAENCPGYPPNLLPSNNILELQGRTRPYNLRNRDA